MREKDGTALTLSRAEAIISSSLWDWSWTTITPLSNTRNLTGKENDVYVAGCLRTLLLRNLIVCNLIVVWESNGCFLLKGGKGSQKTEGGHGSWKQEVCQEVADRSHADLLQPTKTGLHRKHPHLLTFTHANTHTNQNGHTLTVEEASVIQTSCRHWLSPPEREAVKKFVRRSIQQKKKFTIELHKYLCIFQKITPKIFSYCCFFFFLCVCTH